MRHLVAGRRGQSTIELALLVTLLMLLTLGAVQFGILYGVKLRVVHAAREGARYAAVNVRTRPDTDIQQHVIAAAPDLTPPITQGQVEVETPEGETADKPVRVTVTYVRALTMPLVRILVPTVTFEESVEMRIEGT